MKGLISALPPELREAIDQATRSGRVCVQHMATGELLADERAPIDSPSALELWISEHPGYSSLCFLRSTLIFFYTVFCFFHKKIFNIIFL